MKRTHYVVEVGAASNDDQVAACRAVLTAMAAEVIAFESDIPPSGLSPTRLVPLRRGSVST